MAGCNGIRFTGHSLGGTIAQCCIRRIIGWLCSNASNCTGTYDNGGVTIGQVKHATRFGYLIEGEAGPELVSFNNEQIGALQGGFASPVSILRGNPNATRVDFIGVDVDGDGGSDIDWGEWNNSAANPALLLKDAKNIENADTVAAPFYYVSAMPAPAASRVPQAFNTYLIRNMVIYIYIYINTHSLELLVYFLKLSEHIL